MQKVTNVSGKNQHAEYNQKEGDVFGRLTLTGKTYFKEVYGTRRRIVEARCVCGTIQDYVFDLLKRGQTKSCGCLRSDLMRENPINFKHGLTKHPLFKVWDGMKDRCYNPNHLSHKYYYDKGITICPEWLNDFKSFYLWAMANGYRKGLTIDRINGKGNYEPSNCRFITWRRQRMNMDGVTAIQAFGETKCLAEWIEDPRCKVSEGGLRFRLTVDKDRWPDIEKAISTPPTPYSEREHHLLDLDKTYIIAFRESKSINEWLKDDRCVAKDISVIKSRRKKGWEGTKIIGTPIRASRNK